MPSRPGIAISSSSRSGLRAAVEIDRTVAVACGADELRAFGLGQQELKPLGRERFVVRDQDADRLFVSHQPPPA